ncbi:hypothetical protein F3N42_03095 [Marinihelvus fidelis]|uniref:Transcription factor zinc-finger domain-containing protein n=1 Tax=Marinihelvus fidelis TaxID=2613842 RepID=A0A5N0TE88_9GAMM|nr:zf-TFIIB domain-containing protein [Marinihelvus fidelis]KAA9133352.1 hypothetical protein F3N42_03095 [Marinihelvus fidelis]
MICPKCSAEMEIAIYDEVRVDRCTNCKGLWFDTGELERLRKDTWMADYILDTGSASEGKKYNRIDKINCPHCGVAMKEEFDADQPHIMYETCPDGHGTFLDAGEFTDLVKKTFWDRFKRAR